MRTARVDLSNLRITCRTRLDMPTLSLASMADALQQPAWGGSSGAAAPSLVCGAAHVTSWADMAQAAALMQPHANTTFVVLRANLTVSEPSNVGDIPVYRCAPTACMRAGWRGAVPRSGSRLGARRAAAAATGGWW